MSIPEILRTYKTIAVVGLSSRRTRPSYGVAEYMQSAGYRIIPVNPAETAVLGEKAYPDLGSIPEPVEIVNIFRRSEFVADIAIAALARNGKVGFFWMQDGVVDEDSAARLVDAGIPVAMDRCIYRDRETIFSAIGGR